MARRCGIVYFDEVLHNPDDHVKIISDTGEDPTRGFSNQWLRDITQEDLLKLKESSDLMGKKLLNDLNHRWTTQDGPEKDINITRQHKEQTHERKEK